MSAVETTPPARRKRGNSAGITPARIVAAARGLDPDNLTMQAVADELGVDRKAVVYHVNDKEALLELLAVDAFSVHFAATVIPASADWKQAIQYYATGMKDSLVASGGLATYFRLNSPSGVASVQTAETVLEKMISAGFDTETAARSLVLITDVVMAYARDVVMNAREGGHPQKGELHRIVQTPEAGSLGALRDLDETQFEPYDDRQFDFAINTLLRGLFPLLNEPT